MDYSVLLGGYHAFLSAQAQRKRLAPRRGSLRNQQRLPNTQDEDGDPMVPSFHSKVKGPMGQL